MTLLPLASSALLALAPATAPNPQQATGAAGSFLVTGGTPSSAARAKSAPPPPAAALQTVGTQTSGLVWGSDSCATPDPLPATGETGYYTGNATTGPEGQGWSICDFIGTPLIENDVWFVWIAPSTGSAVAYTCPSGTGLDPRIAVHEGSRCPASAPLECSDDDGCTGSIALGSWVTFETHAGQPYLIQVGSYPGTPTGTGMLTVRMALPSQGWKYQNDSTPFEMGGLAPTGGGGIAWMQRFNAKAGQDDIVSVQAAFGIPSPVFPLHDGDPATVAIWSDPDQDGKPHDAQLLISVPTTIQNAHTGILNEIPLPTAVHVTGKFFVGVATVASPGQAPAVFSDSSWQGFDQSRKSWVIGSSTGPVDLACLDCNDFGPASLSDLQISGAHFMVRAVGGGTSDTFCYGTQSKCPCGNGGGGLGEGCTNSSGAGALLWGTGSAKVSKDDLVLHAMHFGKGGGAALAVAGSQQQAAGTGIPFQSGLLCVGGSVHRYPGQFAIDMFAQDSVVALSGGLIAPGSTWYFQVWFRDGQGTCGFNSNLSNGLQIDFVP